MSKKAKTTATESETDLDPQDEPQTESDLDFGLGESATDDTGLGLDETDAQGEADVPPTEVTHRVHAATGVSLRRGIPMPEVVSGRRAKYPWDDMEVGESFFIGGVSESTISSSRLTAQKRLEGRKFAVRSVTENGVEGVCAWRVE
ncbi:hypothetical protein D2N39_11580 [Gemmobacter lutimaris]|uniref:Uncharacterized protein n=1 Tax=Gemmobacter lutimaris TaxID=2306023 RepID=A0A398BSJ6_9RHOB|nr:hypothetical protein [Gemmobacter lutimaris]RID91871.1 hypothetical protein D2N39_11580 [Gemmobacter lutimaris]